MLLAVTIFIGVVNLVPLGMLTGFKFILTVSGGRFSFDSSLMASWAKLNLIFKSPAFFGAMLMLVVGVAVFELSCTGTLVPTEAGVLRSTLSPSIFGVFKRLVRPGGGLYSVSMSSSLTLFLSTRPERDIPGDAIVAKVDKTKITACELRNNNS